MEPAPQPRPAGPGLRDLMGFMVGFALAAMLLRRVRPDQGANLIRLAGSAMAYLWFGLVMSGPFVAWLFRVGDPGQIPDRKPKRTGQWIGSVSAAPASAGPQSVRAGGRERPGGLSPERVWIHLGTFWVFFGFMGMNSIDPGSFLYYLSVQATWFTVLLTVVLLCSKRPSSLLWTDRLAWLILMTWPVAVGGLWLAGHGCAIRLDHPGDSRYHARQGDQASRPREGRSVRINRRGVVGIMVGGAVASGVLALGVALGRESDAVRAERSKMEGAWVAESVRSVSGEITGDAAAPYQLEFRDGTVVARGLSGVPESRGRFRVLPGTDPAKIDLRLESGIVFGVYRLEGDTLTAVFNPIDLPEHLGLPERGRPERLEADEKRLLFRYARRDGSR